MQDSADLQMCFAQLGAGWRDLPVPKDLAKKAAETPEGLAITLHYHQRRHTSHSHIARFMHLTGPGVEVQTLFLYPAANRLQPVLAAETVAIGGQAQMLTLDMPLLLCDDLQMQDATANAMQALALQWMLASDSQAPEWLQSCQSGHALYLRNPLGQTAQYFNAYAQAATHLWLDWMAQAPSHPELQAHAQAIARYKQHHREHSPSAALLSRCFGPDWTESFTQAFFA